MIEDREVITTFVTVAWQEARTRHFVCWSLQAFVNYLKGTVAVNTRTTGTRRNVGRQRAIVYVGNYAKSRIKCNGVSEMVGEGGVVGCLRGSSVVGEISLCSLRSPSPHKRLQLQLQWHSLQTTPPYASRRLPRELTVTCDGPARPNPDMD